MQNVTWIVDSEGDFGVKVGEKVCVFYKWHDGTLLEEAAGVIELTDANSKSLWHKVRQAVEEWKEEEGLK